MFDVSRTLPRVLQQRQQDEAASGKLTYHYASSRFSVDVVYEVRPGWHRRLNHVVSMITGRDVHEYQHFAPAAAEP
jgi:hypothetical protein